jgi:hypothetical protein
MQLEHENKNLLTTSAASIWWCEGGETRRMWKKDDDYTLIYPASAHQMALPWLHSCWWWALSVNGIPCLSLYKIRRFKLRFRVYGSTTLVAIVRTSGWPLLINHICPTPDLLMRAPIKVYTMPNNATSQSRAIERPFLFNVLAHNLRVSDIDSPKTATVVMNLPFELSQVR